MKDVIVGTFELNDEPVLLVLRAGVGGNYLSRSDDRKPVLFQVGGDQTYWRDVVGSLLHEAKEFVDMRMGCRFEPSPNYAYDNGSYLFVETHTQHSEVCWRVGAFLAQCLPDLERAWKQWQRQAKKGK
jgi:hypothetical protein